MLPGLGTTVLTASTVVKTERQGQTDAVWRPKAHRLRGCPMGMGR